MLTIGIDPGICAGFAVLQDGKLKQCGILDEDTWPKLEKLDLSMLYIERPVIYPGPRQKARPNDIITLALRAGETVGRLGVKHLYVTPQDWKRNLSKEVCHQRLITLMTNPEWEIARKELAEIADSKQHNLLDAIGIAFYGSGRKVFQ